MSKILTCVLRCADRQDCTNGGITSKHSMLTLFYDCEREDALKECELKNINPNKCLLLVKRWRELGLLTCQVANSDY